MRLNLDYYKEDLNYNKNYSLEDEEKIKSFFDKKDLETNEEIYKTDENWNVVEAVSNYRQNILNWYDFKKGSNLLEIGACFGELTGLFCEKCRNVVAVEFSKNRGEIIEKRWGEKDNLEVIIGNLKDISFNQKFDYITLMGCMDYAEDLMGDGNNSYLSMLEFARDLLNEDGVILLATDNSFGIKYLAGEKSEHADKIYGTFSNDFTDGRLFTRKELCQCIEKANLKKQRFYYPLPNYKLPEVIFSEEYLPEKSLSKLDYYIYYNENSIINKSEIDLIKQFNKNDLFEYFCNSYLVELSKNDRTDNSISFISFNNIRKEKYNLMLKMSDDGEVCKSAVNAKNTNHIEKCIENLNKLKDMGFNTIESESNGVIYSKYQKYDTLDKVIAKKIEEEKIEDAYEIIDRWFTILKEKFLKENSDGGLNYIGTAYIDLVFENIFYIENEFFIFDQEWSLEKIPLEFIFYRAIENLYFYHSELENILEKTEMLSRYNLLENIEIFRKIEKEFQLEVVDGDISEFFRKKIANQFYNIESMLDYKKEILKCIEIINGKNERIENLSKAVDEIEVEIEKRDNILKMKQEEIDSLRSELTIYKSSRLIELIRKLGEERKKMLCNKKSKK